VWHRNLQYVLLVEVQPTYNMSIYTVKQNKDIAADVTPTRTAMHFSRRWGDGDHKLYMASQRF
jgi:hypothetical protein